jgi:glycosyltransferase involved in cell wall biosynthesis
MEPFADVEDSSIRERLGVDDDVRLITLVANLRHDVKNVPMLLRCAALIIQQRSDVRFVIAGEGELERSLKQTAVDLGVAANVYFIGGCTNVPALLSTSHACVLTSTAEGFSNSILEYMAAGRPVVATDVGGAAEAIVVGRTGFLVPSDDDQTMAKYLLDLLNNEEKAKQMGDAGRERVTENFSEAAQLDRTIDLYESVLKP